MRYVLVLRDTKSGTSKVWQGKSVAHLLKRARAHVTKYGTSWADEKADRLILTHYNVDLSASAIALRLTARLHKRITKNMVISRYHRLAGHGEPEQDANHPREALQSPIG